MRGKHLYIFLMLAGVLLGPVYWFYEKLYSGELATTLAMAEIGDGGYATTPFKLDASMQPAGLILRTQGHFVPRQDEDKPPGDAYLATLYKDGVASQSIPFPIAVSSVANSNPAFNERLFLLDSLKGAEYRLEIRPTKPPAITLEQPRLEIRARIEEPDNRIATAGFLVLVFGFLMLFLG